MRKVRRILSFACLVLLPLLVFASCKPNTLKPPEEGGKFSFSTDLTKRSYTYKEGETMRFTVAVTNNSGEDLQIMTNGYMPDADLYSVDDTIPRVRPAIGIEQSFKADEKIEKTFEFALDQKGKYILAIFYSFSVDGVPYSGKFEDISVRVR